jgi:hypothetical protein
MAFTGGFEMGDKHWFHVDCFIALSRGLPMKNRMCTK